MKAVLASLNQGFVVAPRMDAVVAVAAEGDKFKQELVFPMVIAQVMNFGWWRLPTPFAKAPCAFVN